jgi:hypothetical protein
MKEEVTLDGQSKLLKAQMAVTKSIRDFFHSPLVDIASVPQRWLPDSTASGLSSRGKMTKAEDEETRTDPKPKMFPKPLFVSASMSLVMTDHEQAVKYSYLPFVSSPPPFPVIDLSMVSHWCREGVLWSLEAEACIQSPARRGDLRSVHLPLRYLCIIGSALLHSVNLDLSHDR